MGARELKLWSLGDEDEDDDDCEHEQRQTFTGHTSNVNLLRTVVLAEHEYVLSTSKMDRTVSMWRCKSGGKYKNAVATFLMADVALTLSCCVVDDVRLEVVAVTRSGVAHLFIVDDVAGKIVAGGGAGKPIKPKVTIEIASDDQTTGAVAPVAVVTAAFNGQSTTALAAKNQVLIGYGDRQFLQFELIEYNTVEKNQVLIRQDPKKSVTGSAQQKLAAARDKSLLKTVTPVVEAGSVEYQTATTLTRKAKAIEMPMETRLENLSLGETPQTQRNVAQLLVQGLHNHDAK